MRCNNTNSNLIFYAENSLTARRRAQIESHLEECPDCREYLSFIRESMLVIENEKEVKPSPFIYTRIMAGLESKRKIAQGRTKKLIPAFAFTVILIVSVIGGINLGKLYSSVTYDYSNELQEEVSYFDELEQEKIETFFLNLNDEENE